MPSASLGGPTGYSIGRVECTASMASAASRDGAKPTQRSHDGRKASTQSVSMNVAKASLSQMPSHQLMVTRSPNHMWASSCAITSATRSSSVRAAFVLVDEQRRVAEGDAAQVLHGAGGEVGDGDEVDLLARVGDVEVVGEEAQCERADLEGEVGQGASSRACRPPGAARRRRRPSRSPRACR